jgi:ankyrin repeat protein
MGQGLAKDGPISSEVLFESTLGATPLHKALSEHGMNFVWLREGNRELHDPNIVQALLAAGADVNAKTASGLTPLHYAARIGRVDIVRLLLARGASVSPQDQDGDTPLHEAREAGHEGVVELLVSAAAEGWCPLVGPP